MTDQKNLLLFVGITMVILIGFEFLYVAPQREQFEEQQALQQAIDDANQEAQPPAAPQAPSTAGGGEAPALPGTAATPGGEGAISRDMALAQTSRVAVAAPRVGGSISLTGGRIDDLTLIDYNETLEPDSPKIDLLLPVGTADAYYAEFGWVPQDATVAVPSSETEWTADAAALVVGTPVNLSWDNGNGLRYVNRFEIDADYMFTVTQRVENSGVTPVTLYPYGLISRSETPVTLGFYILHEGLLGVFNGTLDEQDYDDLQEKGTINASSTGGWIGITDKYWLVALVPDQAAPFSARYVFNPRGGRDKYQVDYQREAMVVLPGGSIEVTDHLFAGAKEVSVLDNYQNALSITNFGLAVDWGWFYFLTRPFFLILSYFTKLIGNFGLSILLFTVIIKLIFFPLANKSYKSMSKMKKLQPKMVEMKEKYGDDKAKLQQEMMALYKAEKVNPMSGCLPIIVQIPVFFALYKVLFVSIEMRHTPFYGWIRDLSAPDPTTVFNLFGLIPWTPPDMLLIGVWPLIMGATMWLQQKLNPTPPDPTQAKIMMMLPIVFTFILARFPAGLVIYWCWNNTLSIAQQWFIMHKMGVKIGDSGSAAKPTDKSS